MNQIESLCEKLKQEFGTSDPFELCGRMGVIVLFVKLPMHIKGFYCNMADHRMVYINNRLKEGEQRMVCAHELGHALLHAELNVMFINQYTNLKTVRYENEADYFSACLLIDDALLDCTSGLSTLADIASCAGVDERLVELRLWRFNGS